MKLQIKENEIKNKDKELLGIKGLLTSRGIFEFFINLCFGELQELGLCGKYEKCNITNTLNKMNKMENRELYPSGGYSARILYAAEHCNANLTDVYKTLCNEIHGSRWSGPGVQVYASMLTEREKCIVNFIANDMNLIMAEE